MKYKLDAMTQRMERLIIIYVNAGNDISVGSMLFPVRKWGGGENASVCALFANLKALCQGDNKDLRKSSNPSPPKKRMNKQMMINVGGVIIERCKYCKIFMKGCSHYASVCD